MAIQIYSQKSNAWRDAYNPLRGMSLPKVISLLDAEERGASLIVTFHFHPGEGGTMDLPANSLRFRFRVSAEHLVQAHRLYGTRVIMGGQRRSFCLFEVTNRPSNRPKTEKG